MENRNKARGEELLVAIIIQILTVQQIGCMEDNNGKKCRESGTEISCSDYENEDSCPTSDSDNLHGFKLRLEVF